MIAIPTQFLEKTNNGLGAKHLHHLPFSVLACPAQRKILVQQKVTEMKTRLRALDATTKAHLTRQADKATAQLERQRELDSICMVVDMVRVRSSAYAHRTGEKQTGNPHSVVLVIVS